MKVCKVYNLYISQIKSVSIGGTWSIESDGGKWKKLSATGSEMIRENKEITAPVR